MKSDINKKNTHRSVQPGVEQPVSINPNLSVKRIKNRKPQKSVSDYVEGILAGNRVILSQAITLIESKKSAHRTLAQEIIEKCLPQAGKSIRIGITGTPGVGKSTFIEAFGKHITGQGKKVAVLAIDPTSKLSGGSILGDKTRMEQLSSDENAFIRPSPAGDSLGGVARKTRETIVLCEAAGYDHIIVETVGVGQSEIAVHSMVDFFLLLLLPGAGDELQGIKRGIVEMADMIAVNKADGDRLNAAKQAKVSYRNALHLFPPSESGWIPQTAICSAVSGMGIENIEANIHKYQKQTTKSGWWTARRQRQAQYWLEESIQDRLQRLFAENVAVKSRKVEIEKAVLEGRMSSFRGAEELLNLFER
ncbi:MAG: LAO/AO transport system kinase [Saprospiraceae bacterium]|jgi:LAO/AO transport system kinase